MGKLHDVWAQNLSRQLQTQGALNKAQFRVYWGAMIAALLVGATIILILVISRPVPVSVYTCYIDSNGTTCVSPVPVATRSIAKDSQP